MESLESNVEQELEEFPETDFIRAIIRSKAFEVCLLAVHRARCLEVGPTETEIHPMSDLKGLRLGKTKWKAD